MTNEKSTVTSQVDLIKAIYVANHTDVELLRLVREKQAMAWECHANGAYGSAQEQMITASLARQLIEVREIMGSVLQGLADARQRTGEQNEQLGPSAGGVQNS